MKNWLNQILTGANNQTLAIGRVLGIIMAIVFLFILPSIAVVAIALKWMTADDWHMIFRELTTYEPAVAISIAGMIGLTAFSEPRQNDNDGGNNPPPPPGN